MVRALIVGLANAYMLLIFVYVLMSWLPNVSHGIVGQVYDALGKLCDPYLDLFRRLIPPLGNIDFSPIVAVLVLQFVARLVVRLL